MAKKVKLTKGGQTVYPATVMDAVVHPDLRVDSSKLIEEVNVSKIYPTGGIDGTNKYTLETAIAMIPASLRNVGIKCSFLDEAGKEVTWEYLGNGYTNLNRWICIGATGLNRIYESIAMFTSRGSITFNDDFTQVTIGAGIYYLRSRNSVFRSFTLQEDFVFSKTNESSALVLDTSSNSLAIRSIYGTTSDILDSDILLAAYDSSEGFCKNSILYNYIFDAKIANLQSQFDKTANLNDFMYRGIIGYKKTSKMITSGTDEYIGIYGGLSINKGDVIQVNVEPADGLEIRQFRIALLASDGNKDMVSVEESFVNRNFYYEADKAYTGINLVILASDIISTGTVNAYVTIGDAGYSKDVVLLRQELQKNQNELGDKIDDIADRVYKEKEVLYTQLLNMKESANYLDINYALNKGEKYIINISNTTGVITSWRISQIADEGTFAILAHPQPVGTDVEFTAQATTQRLRIVVEAQYVQTPGTINAQIKSLPYDIAEDMSELQDNVSKNTQDIAKLQGSGLVHDIMFPVPTDIYCAVGVDMNLYYENMFGMLSGTGYMFIDSPSIVYDTSAAESGNSYDAFLNLERQLHFKPNMAGDMELYLNVWDDYMQQVAAKKTTLHIINTTHMPGKTINMLVNGSSSIDVGTFQSEIKRLLENAGATVNMVGRWASGNNNAGTSYNLKAENRLSENRSGGASNLYTTKANDGKTKIVHPTNITNLFFGWNTELEDPAGNHWMVWGNNSEFVELVLKSGDMSTIPTSGIMNKVAGSGEDSLIYDGLITNVPQTTNPFWNNADNGISFTDYCNNWNRPTPNVFVTLWGTNDIGGSSGEIETGKQWATDRQITTFVERQKVLVDAFTRDCPDGIIIMCPQPTGSSLTGIKNSDRNGMLFSKLKAIQALMDAFADYTNVIIVPVQWWFDRKYAYTIKPMTVSERMKDFYGDTLLDEVTDDSTHPQARGYFQMADAVYSAIVYAFL